MHRREFLGSAAVAALPAPRSFPFQESTVAELSKQTARSLTIAYIARIHALDRGKVNSVIELNPDALEIADVLDRERRTGNVRGPLHGIPVLIKDNIDTADKMMTTAGSLALAGKPAPMDSTVAKRLRDAGAVILGKTNLSEWANFRSTHSSSGWSGRGRQTRNPYALDRNPCGSSSGSGAAVSANFCALAVGTETDGSIVCPSSMNGVVGIKPTLGLISRAGIVPIAHSQDTAGPMARTLRDAAILLGVLAGADDRDSLTSTANTHIQADYTRFLDPSGLRGARIGVARKFFTMGTAVDLVLEKAIGAMRTMGAVIVDPADLPSHGQYDSAENDVLQYEFKTDLEQYLRGRGETVSVKSLADVIEFNRKQSAKEMPYFGQEILEQSQKRGSLTDQAYLDALAKCRRLARDQGIDAVISEHKLDAIIGPTAGPAWLTDLITGDHDTGGCSTPAAVAGYPHITVPAGFVRGLPIGISFFGPAWSEPTLLKLAYSFEQATEARRVPTFRSTLNPEP